MTKTRLASQTPTAWNQPFALTLTLASRHDLVYNYVTFSTKQHLAAMFGNTMTWKRFTDTFHQGDYFLLQINGQVNVVAKINRATMESMAFHAPRTVEMPSWGPLGAKPVTVNAVLLGFTGLNAEPKVRYTGGESSEPVTNPDQPFLSPLLEGLSGITIVGDNMKVFKH